MVFIMFMGDIFFPTAVCELTENAMLFDHTGYLLSKIIVK